MKRIYLVDIQYCNKKKYFKIQGVPNKTNIAGSFRIEFGVRAYVFKMTKGQKTPYIFKGGSPIKISCNISMTLNSYYAPHLVKHYKIIRFQNWGFTLKINSSD